MTSIKLSMSTQVRFTCKSFLSCDSCLPFVLEFYNGTALEVAIDGGHEDVAEILREAGTKEHV